MVKLERVKIFCVYLHIRVDKRVLMGYYSYALNVNTKGKTNEQS